MSKITVTTIAGATSGSDANKVKIESGDDFNVVSGKVGIGTVNAPSNKNTVTPSLNVSGSGVNGAAQITRHTSVGGGGALLHLSGTRGSDVNSYTIVQNNDGIGTVSFQGADGNEFVQGAAIQANVDGTPGDNDMPTRLGFFVTSDGASTSTERMRIHNGGVVSFNNGIELGSGLDATTANTLDDYEEGTWTPTLGNVSAPTFSSRNGTYTKIGRIVYLNCEIVVGSGLDTSDGSTFYVQGFPFGGNSATESLVFSIGRFSTLISNRTVVAARFLGDGLALKEGGANELAYNECASSGVLQFSCTYSTS